MEMCILSLMVFLTNISFLVIEFDERIERAINLEQMLIIQQ